MVALTLRKLAPDSPDNEEERRALAILMGAQYADAGMLDHELRRNAPVNRQDQHGMTALHHAAARGARPCIRLLVGCGRCDYLIKDDLGRYAFELAIEGACDYAVARLLLKKQMQQAAAQGVPAYVPRV